MLTQRQVFFLPLALLCSLWVCVLQAEDRPLQRALDSITSQELLQHVQKLADDSFEGREAGSQGGRAASIYLEKSLRQLELQGGADGQFYQAFGAGMHNVLAIFPGNHPELKHEVVILGAHYDHIGYGDKITSNGPIGFIHNGADDNASGTAALLEIAEAFSKAPKPPRRTILFAFWDGEEKGLLGSKRWTQHPTQPVEHLVMYVNLDMIGRLGDQGVEVSGSRSALGLRQWISRRNANFQLKLFFPWTTNDLSDHWPFYELGIPVIMFHTGLHDDYHRPSDDAHLINGEGMQQLTQLVFRCVYDLANDTTRHRFRQQSHEERNPDKLAFEKKLTRPPRRLGVSWSAKDSQGTGIRLTKVGSGTAAQRAGLKIGDRLVELNAQSITNGNHFRQQIQTTPAEITLTVQRLGLELPLKIPVQLSGSPLRMGISWRVDPGEPNAITLVRVLADSPAELAGLKLADRIYEINGDQFSGSDQFAGLAHVAVFPVTLLVERNGRLHTLTLRDDPVNVQAHEESTTSTNPSVPEKTISN